jgi:hypothetical protein
MKLADEPTIENRDAFYQAFVRSRVGVRATGDLSRLPHHYVTKADDTFSIPKTTAPDGQAMLLLLADVDQLAKYEAHSSFIEMDAGVVLNMALKEHVGIIVQALLPGRSAWAGIPQSDISGLAHKVETGPHTC